MNTNKNILCTICARGGSKGVKNKNIRELLGKPLIAYTIEYFLRWNHCLELVCSTDSKKIADIARKHGAKIPYMRPKELASDTAFKIHVLQDLVKTCEQQNNKRYDIIVDGSLADYVAFHLTSPPRVVVDLMGVKSTVVEKALNFDGPWVKGVRFGVYTSKVRVVFDIIPEEGLPYDIILEEGRLVVSFKPGSGFPVQ